MQNSGNFDFCKLLLSWGNYGQVCVEEKNWQDLGINPQERGRLFWYHATCYSATQEDCPADMCFWDEVNTGFATFKKKQ